MIGARLGFALALVVGGCGPRRGSSRPTLPPTPWEHAAYRTGAPPETTKVFLIAGGDDIANFAAEIAEQRELWRDAGLGDDEIACYWAHPTRRAYRGDRAQYDAVRDAMADCWRAEPQTVLAHLRAAAAADPPWLYVFVTSHGLPRRMTRRPSASRPTPAQRLGLTESELAALDHPAVALQAGPGPVLEDADGIVAAFRSGTPAEALVFTPPTLAAALGRLPGTTPKFVVIQACFSGGFIADDRGDSALAALPNLLVLSATAYDRPSFGCAAGRAKSWFGGAYNAVLARYLEPDARPPDLPWARLHADVQLVIDAIESIDAERPSQPRLLVTPPPGEASREVNPE